MKELVNVDEFLQMAMENNGISPEAVASVFLLCEVSCPPKYMALVSF